MVKGLSWEYIIVKNVMRKNMVIRMLTELDTEEDIKKAEAQAKIIFESIAKAHGEIYRRRYG